MVMKTRFGPTLPPIAAALLLAVSTPILAGPRDAASKQEAGPRAIGRNRRIRGPG